jgi:PIN domain nuclease of toxin-antitoxin system
VILLDTHVPVWLDAASDRLGAGALALIDEAFQNDALAVSAISFWEVAMLARKGRLRLGEPPSSWRRYLLSRGLREIPVDGHISITAGTLDGFHGDLADRTIVSTAESRARLVTADEAILDWERVPCRGETPENRPSRPHHECL